MEKNIEKSNGRIDEQSYRHFREELGYMFLKENADNYFYVDNSSDIHMIPKKCLFLMMNYDLQSELEKEYNLERK